MDLSEYENAVRAEYDKFVAKAAIFIGGVRAFNFGHPVPASYVEAHPELVEEGLVGAPDDPPAAPVEAAAPPQGDDIPLDPQ